MLRYYDQLIESLKTKGIIAWLQKPGQLVISAKFPNVPSHNSFWVTFSNGLWYLSTWTPVMYRVSRDKDICTVCETVLESSATAIYRVAEDCTRNCGLWELSSEETDLVMREAFGDS